MQSKQKTNRKADIQYKFDKTLKPETFAKFEATLERYAVNAQAKQKYGSFDTAERLMKMAQMAIVDMDERGLFTPVAADQEQSNHAESIAKSKNADRIAKSKFVNAALTACAKTIVYNVQSIVDSGRDMGNVKVKADLKLAQDLLKRAAVIASGLQDQTRGALGYATDMKIPVENLPQGIVSDSTGATLMGYVIAVSTYHVETKLNKITTGAYFPSAEQNILRAIADVGRICGDAPFVHSVAVQSMFGKGTVKNRHNAFALALAAKRIQGAKDRADSKPKSARKNGFYDIASVLVESIREDYRCAADDRNVHSIETIPAQRQIKRTAPKPRNPVVKKVAATTDLVNDAHALIGTSQIQPRLSPRDAVLGPVSPALHNGDKRVASHSQRRLPVAAKVTKLTVRELEQLVPVAQTR